MKLAIKKAGDRLQDRWQSLTVQEIFNALKLLSVVAIVLTLLGFYFLNKGEERVQRALPEERDVTLSDDALNRDLDARIEHKVQAVMDKFMRTLDSRLSTTHSASNPSTDDPSATHATDPLFSPPSEEALGDIDALGLSAGDSTAAKSNNGNGNNKSNSNSNNHNDDNVDYIEQINFGYPTPPSNTADKDVNIAPVFHEIGGIATTVINAPQKNNTQQVDKKTTFQIPVGFMPAKLLVGIRAQTNSDGASNPKPVHFRVQAPATLPNKVRMNLRGCFVIANTWGNLATERIEVELKSLHCISRDKKILIEGDIHGYLADVDGQRDMHGRVVTKSGSLIARQVLADVLGGIGDTIANNAGSTQTSALGTVKTLDGDSMYKAGLAGGASSGFKRTSEFIANLVLQSGPIIESGAAKDVMLMIQKTSEIEIKTLDMGDF